MTGRLFSCQLRGWCDAQAQQQAAQAQQVAAAKAVELQDAARAKAAELYTQVCCRVVPHCQSTAV